MEMTEQAWGYGMEMTEQAWGYGMEIAVSGNDN